MFFTKIIKFFKKIKNNQQGFSLTEIIVTAGIIGSLGTVATAQVTDYLPVARDAQRMANVRQVQTALNIYYDDHLEYPKTFGHQPTVNGWQEVVEALQNGEKVYMPEVPVDPINQEQYQFKYWSDGQTFKIWYETEDELDASPRVAWGM